MCNSTPSSISSIRRHFVVFNVHKLVCWSPITYNSDIVLQLECDCASKRVSLMHFCGFWRFSDAWKQNGWFTQTWVIFKQFDSRWCKMLIWIELSNNDSTWDVTVKKVFLHISFMKRLKKSCWDAFSSVPTSFF